MADQLVEECCQLYHSGIDCNYPNPQYLKGVIATHSFKAPAITACILSAAFCLLALFVIRNIVVLIRKRDRKNIKVQFIMNVLTAFPITFRTIFWFDGPLQLISGGNLSFSPSMETSLQVFSNCFLNITLAYSSYCWIQLILQSKNKWEATYKPMIINSAFICDGIFLITIMILSTALIASNLESGFLMPLIPLSVASFLNSIIFSVSCYWMGQNLTDIYDFESPKRRKILWLKALAIAVALFSMVRVFINLFSYIFQFWQQKMNVQSYCDHDLSWSTFVFAMSLTADLTPLALCLIVFAPESKQKTKQSFQDDLQNQLVDSSSEDGDIHSSDSAKFMVSMRTSLPSKGTCGSF